MRYLILIHRYLGTAIGIVMLGWCLTGIVMMYVRYPQLSATEQMRHLAPIAWQKCCAVSANNFSEDVSVEEFQLENLADHPVLHLQFTQRPREVIDLATGEALAKVSQQQATEVVTAGTHRTARLMGLIDYDVWTVSGEFNRGRPLYQFALEDSSGTQVYVSSKNGRIVQLTTARQRFWNWVGAVPHWLYFTQLRHQPRLWTQVVIWTSLAGCFLAFFGLFIGIRQSLRSPAGMWSTYRGLWYWHHIPGLIFGLFALTWVASGLISMNPWGFLDSDREARGVDDMIGPPFTAAQVRQTLQSLAAASLPADVVSLQSVRLWGQLFLIESRADGTRVRVDANGNPAPLTNSDWTKIGMALGGAHPSAPELITAGDSYYYSRPGVAAQFPVYRVVADDPPHTRFYLDAISGTPVNVVDGNARWYRWLHLGLHTLDFSNALRLRPVWDLVMLVLLAGAALVCATGTWLGWRRYIRI